LAHHSGRQLLQVELTSPEQNDQGEGVQIQKDDDLSATASTDVSAQNQGSAGVEAKAPLAESFAEQKPQ